MDALIVFAKAPVAGNVKTRLCPPLSHGEAAGLYGAFVEDVLAGARAAAVPVSMAYEPYADHPSPPWAVPWFPQAAGDLGARLIAAFARGFADGASKVVVIGSDCPDLPPGLLREAFSRLDAADAVFGPAEDGGYYLVGLKRPMPSLFAGVQWSGPTVLESTLSRLRRAGTAFELLARRADVDTPSDLAALERRLAAGRSLAPRSAAALAGLSRN